MSADPLLRVHREPDEASARTWSATHPGVLTIWADGETAGSYLNGTRCAIPFRAHQWVQGLINGRKIWTPPPDLLTWWDGEPNNSVSVLSIRVPYNNSEAEGLRRTETRNMCTQPYPVSKHNIWNVVSEQLDDGLWRYRVDGSYERGTVRAAIKSTAVAVGDVLVLVYECDQPNLLIGLNTGSKYCMRGCDWLRGGTVSDRIGWNACRIVDTSLTNHEFALHRDAGWVTIRGVANYTAADWPHIERQITAGRLPASWFAPPRDAPAGVKTTPRLIP